jgi:hypothetical protein
MGLFDIDRLSGCTHLSADADHVPTRNRLQGCWSRTARKYNVFSCESTFSVEIRRSQSISLVWKNITGISNSTLSMGILKANESPTFLSCFLPSLASPPPQGIYCQAGTHADSFPSFKLKAPTAPSILALSCPSSSFSSLPITSSSRRIPSTSERHELSITRKLVSTSASAFCSGSGGRADISRCSERIFNAVDACASLHGPGSGSTNPPEGLMILFSALSAQSSKTCSNSVYLLSGCVIATTSLCTLASVCRFPANSDGSGHHACNALRFATFCWAVSAAQTASKSLRSLACFLPSLRLASSVYCRVV